MKLQDTPKMFGTLSIALHWLTALFVLTLLGTGLYSMFFKWFVTGQRAGFGWFDMFLHIYVGTIAIPFIIWRVWWRVKSGHPEEPKQTGLLQWLTAINWPLLLILIVVCFVTGPFLQWLHGNPLVVFGVPVHPPFWPRWVVETNNLHDDLVLPIHGFAALALAFLLCLHIGGALKHWIVDRDRVMQRMLRPQPLDSKEV